MFHSDVDAFGDDSGADSFVDHDSDSMRSHVKDSSSASVVKLVRHPLLEGAVAFDVDQISPLVDPQVRRQVLHSSATEVPREHVSRPATVSFRVDHRDWCWADEVRDRSRRTDGETVDERPESSRGNGCWESEMVAAPTASGASLAAHVEARSSMGKHREST